MQYYTFKITEFRSVSGVAKSPPCLKTFVEYADQQPERVDRLQSKNAAVGHPV